MKNPCENIVFSTRKVFVEWFMVDGKKIYHVFITGITHADCDSAYEYEDLAISMAKCLDKIKQPK